MNILKVSNLRVWDELTGQVIVPNSSFHLKQGNCLSIVGESGSGKSMTCRAIMRLNRGSIRQSGDILFRDVNLAELSDKKIRSMRGKHLYMIMQHGMRAFDPSCVIGVHIRETLAQHYGLNRSESEARMIKAMESVRLKDPAQIMNKYPHQLSGGMLQRIMIALAIVLKPDLIIADEPTTALDAISQYEVVEQLLELRSRMGCAIILVSHDLGIVQKLADEVLVMKAGVIVESGTAQAIFSNARHEYTKYLVSSKLALNEHFHKVMGGAGIVDR